jgi:hypothetical protein
MSRLRKSAVPFLAALLALSVTTTSIWAQPPAGKGKGKGQQPTSRIPRGSGKVDATPVKPVDPGRLADVRKCAARIDELIDANYKKHSVTSNPQVSDAVFLRRTYLHLAGRIPKYEEALSFLGSKDPDKRSKLIDELLNSQDHVSHMFNYWGNILRLQDHPINNNQIAQPYHEWIKQSLAENTPYDQWVTQMITSEGHIWDNPAVGYAMRDSGMELDHVDNTVQVFLGTQIGCAQCHDHPFDRWTQKEFYQMAAFLYPAHTRIGVGDKKRFPNGNPVERVRNEMKALDPAYATTGAFGRVLYANLFEVWENNDRKLKLPHDYQYDNGKPREIVAANPIFGSEVKITKGESPRDAFARWLTSPDNPRFAKNIANRMWKHAFGIALIEPSNDLRDDSECSNPELLDFLSSELIRQKYDVRELQRIICHTSVWQREAQVREPTEEGLYQFPGPILRRMTAEQIWDSLLTMAVYGFESFTRPSTQGLAQVVALDLSNATATDVKKVAEEFDAKYSSRAQRKLTITRNSYKKRTILARASELPLPLPSDHFLRQFGQGDRELIEVASTDGNVSQILAMFNGEITHMMLETGSVIYDNTIRAKSVDARIDVIFLSILSRKATSAEDSIARAEIKASGNAGYGNVIWALINTKEFLFIQ